MNGDQINNEILQAVGRIEEQNRNFAEGMKTMCKFRDDSLVIFKDFELYKENRKNIPTDILSLKEKQTFTENAFNVLKTDYEEVEKPKIAFLMTAWGRFAAVIISINIIIGIIVVVSQLFELKFVLK